LEPIRLVLRSVLLEKRSLKRVLLSKDVVRKHEAPLKKNNPDLAPPFFFL